MLRRAPPSGLDRARPALDRSRQGQSSGFIRAGIGRSLAAFVARYPGMSGERLLRDAGIDPKLLETPDAMLSLPMCLAVLESGARESGDAAFGLSFATQIAWQDLGVLGYVLLHSPTVGAALANGCRYFTVQRTVGGLAFQVTPREARLTFNGDTTLRGHAQDAEAMLTIYTRLVRETTGLAEWAPRAVHFRHREPAPCATQRQFFRAPLQFERPQNALVLALADLRLPLRTADPSLLPILLQHAEDRLARLPPTDDFRAQVRRLVSGALSSGDVAVEPIAARLGLSARSLQRRLGELGQSFQDLVSETRLALSRSYLEDPNLSLTETAFLLGYSDLSAFSRAFRRWTGQTALDFRRSLG